MLIAGKSLTKIIRLRDLTEEEIKAVTAPQDNAEPENPEVEPAVVQDESVVAPVAPVAEPETPVTEPSVEPEVPVAEPVAEPVAPAKDEPAVEPVTPAENEDDFVLNGEVDAVKVRRRPAKAPAKKTVAKAEPDPVAESLVEKKNEDDGLGIVQPEFGF